MIVSIGSVADKNDPVSVEVVGFAGVSDDLVDDNVESCVEIDSEIITVGMESDADDIASIVSDTVALIFTVDTVGVVVCGDSTDVEVADVSGDFNLVDDDCISTIPIDSLFGCDTGVC